ncbi:MAG: glycosyltransferase family 4 protein [Opitutus sp.]|nr:glycosyltransferase family 4 protein [Opitutus sp.]MCS6248135.1 glycosyltransferase family 4 protein [Opitutus sp.]MCS6274727.1 glycosyltransferase family 4 protein [Opitutus sp.]MCS6277484.1 glycosyltransferase family 4 protein [Opitutus sp.]MCS6300602.1 glycosyltransferase family 4 protein [Opitutus sp.]
MNDSGPHSVFVITHEFFPKRGGIATFTEEVARAGAALGHKIEVWAQSAAGHPEKPWPFTLRRLPLAGTHNLFCRLKLIVRLIRERRRLRYATVYLPEPGPMLALMALLPLRTFRPRRIVLTFHGSEILRFHADPVTRWLTRRLIRHAFRITTLTHYTKNLLCECFPEADAKTFLTPGALRDDFATVARTPAASAAAAASGKVVVLTVGRIHPRKGQLLALQALQALPPALAERVEYWVAGSANRGGYERTLRAAAARPGPSVRFFGNVAEEELERLYARADIFALTSIDYGHSVEGFGLVYLEASAHGLPVVAHRVGGVAEAVVDGETGLLVAPQHPAALTEAFRQLIEDPVLRSRMGVAGRSWARRTSWSRAAELLFYPGDELPDDPSDE